MNRLKLLLLLLPVFYISTVSAQTPQADLRKMTAMYRSAKSYSMDITARFYSTEPGTAVQSHTGKACKSGSNYFSQMLNRTTIYNSRCRMLVDEEQKLILFNKPNKKEVNSIEPEEQLFMDSVFYATAKVRYISQDAVRKKIEVKTKSGEFDRMELVINAQTYALEQVVYYYAQNTANGVAGYSKTEISYTNIGINKPIPDSLFSEKKYIDRIKNKLTGVGRYATYKVVDQSNTKMPTE